jgi:hypothetical protein
MNWHGMDRPGKKTRPGVRSEGWQRDARHLLIVLALFLGSIAWMVVFRSGAGGGRWGPTEGPSGAGVAGVAGVTRAATRLSGQRNTGSGQHSSATRGKTTHIDRRSSDSSSSSDNPRLLLLSHGRLMWFDLGTEETDVVDAEHGVYYGGFVLGTDLFYVSRPHNWKSDPEAKEYLVNESTGARWELPSKFTHDVVAHGDRVYVADTGNGRIIEVDGGRAIGEVIGAHQLFTAKEHVNTLAVDVTDPRYMWAMLHNLGPSMLAKVDMETRPPRVVERIEGVGKSSHGAVQYEVQGRYVSKLA